MEITGSKSIGREPREPLSVISQHGAFMVIELKRVYTWKKNGPKRQGRCATAQQKKGDRLFFFSLVLLLLHMSDGWSDGQSGILRPPSSNSCKATTERTRAKKRYRWGIGYTNVEIHRRNTLSSTTSIYIIIHRASRRIAVSTCVIYLLLILVGQLILRDFGRLFFFFLSWRAVMVLIFFFTTEWTRSFRVACARDELFDIHSL